MIPFKTFRQSFRAGLLLLMILGMPGCGEKKQLQMAPPDIPVYEVEPMNIPITADFVGQTYGYYDIAIRARVEGFLEGLHFLEGSEVKKGQLLYTIDPQPFEAEVAEQQSRVAQAETRLVKAENDLRRIQPLAEVNAVSQRDLDAAIAERDAAVSEVEAAKAAMKQANIKLSYTRIKSPIRGIIGITEAKVGDFVGREPNPVVLNAVSRLDTILVRFSITETQYLRLARYEREQDTMDQANELNFGLNLFLADGSMYDQQGKIDFANRQVDPTTGTILMQASFPNPEGILRPGQFARIRALIIILTDGIMIPQRCVTEIQGIFQVFVVNEENEVEIRRVDAGRRKGNMWIINEGLAPGEKVILEGMQQARPGSKVNPIVSEFEYIDQENVL
jgi:membrane fusion protein (multidrug efflux system)